ncbi:MAG: hypothetical protein JHC26_04660 [Thermofilum sp.]|uniref:hypothetical protein n=1 Tax=Thermofilum sp. TaxID=1961369 RepID=UPI00258EA972|nr:hypothetical protein [Thermofilum sp.]MCI4408359.1 hypothetical protein [Thermofilum sp.]
MLAGLYYPYESDIRIAEWELGSCRLEFIATVSHERYMYWWSLASLVNYNEPNKIMRFPTRELGVLGAISLVKRLAREDKGAKILVELPVLDDVVASYLSGLDVDVLVAGSPSVYADVIVPARRAGFMRSMMSLSLGGGYLMDSAKPNIDDVVSFENYRSPCKGYTADPEPRMLGDPLRLLFDKDADYEAAKSILLDVAKNGATPAKSLTDVENLFEPLKALIAFGYLDMRETATLTQKGAWALTLIEKPEEEAGETEPKE